MRKPFFLRAPLPRGGNPDSEARQKRVGPIAVLFRRGVGKGPTMIHKWAAGRLAASRGGNRAAPVGPGGNLRRR